MWRGKTRTLGLMIADRQRAVAVSKAAEEFIKQLSLTLKAAQSSGSTQDVERLRKSIGEVVGTLEMALLWPLYKQHPDLEPENLKDWEKGA
jgi:hypothetical protein